MAVAILMIAIAGPLTVAHNGLMAASSARDKMVATFLAQDAVEYIKAVRDENIAQNKANWLAEIADNPLESCNTVEDQCTVDTLSNVFSSGDARLFKNSLGRFSHNSVGQSFSGFSRYYTYESFSADHGRITVYVPWTAGPLSGEAIIRTSLYKINR